MKKLSTKRYLLSYTLNSRSCLFLYFLDSSAMIISLVEVWFGYDLSSILDTARADILRLVQSNFLDWDRFLSFGLCGYILRSISETLYAFKIINGRLRVQLEGLSVILLSYVLFYNSGYSSYCLCCIWLRWCEFLIIMILNWCLF